MTTLFGSTEIQSVTPTVPQKHGWLPLLTVLFLITANIGVQQSAGLRMWCATGANTLAVAAFILKGIIVWRVAIPMLVCTLIGGYWGAHAVQRLTAETARRAVLVFAWTMSLWLLVRSWK